MNQTNLSKIQPFRDYELLPVYIRVAEDLRSKLGEPGFESGKFLPGEYEMAAQYHLSRGTIRKALGILEAEGLLSRQPGRGTLILDPTSQVQVNKAKIAVVWTMVRWIGMEMFSQLEKHISDSNCEIVFFSSQHDYKKEMKILSSLVHSDVQAIILYSTGHQSLYPILQEIQSQGKPILMLDRFISNKINFSHWVTSENEQGAYEITRYLIELGHKRIGMSILTTGHKLRRISTLEERERGYLQAIQEAGLEPLVQKERNATIENKEILGKKLIDFIITNQPTAIFFHNDVSAYRMYTVLNQYGIQIPKDISIAGFDGIKRFDEVLLFELTTMEQDFSAMGKKAGQMILSLIRNPALTAFQARIPVKLRIGETTAPPREDANARALRIQ